MAIQIKGYLFLDFDGVINIFNQHGKMSFPCLKAVSYLNKFINDTKLRVVITSTWRYQGIRYCYEHLKKGGLDLPFELFDRTQTREVLAREEEIEQYLEKEGKLKFLVLDDAYLKISPTYFLRTDCHCGWNEEVDNKLRLMAKKIGLL